MPAPPFAHVAGAHAWERCARGGALSGLMSDGATEALRLLTDQEDAAISEVDPTIWERWRSNRGGGLWRPVGPERCVEREALRGGPEGAQVWDGQRWIAVDGLPSSPILALEADAEGVLWALVSEASATTLRRYAALGSTPLPHVEIPPGLRHLACCADGLVGIDAARIWWRRAAGWAALALPPTLDALAPAAITRWGDGAAALFVGAGRAALALVRRGQVQAAPLDGLGAALGLLSLPDGDLLVGEIVVVDASRERMRFARYRRRASGEGFTWSRIEAWRAVGFDGRALFVDHDGLPWASTARGPRRLVRQPDAYVGSGAGPDAEGVIGVVETWPLDAGTPGTPWHRVFFDAAQPEGTGLRVYARTFDRLDEEPAEWTVALPHLDRRPGWSDRPFPAIERPPFETLEGLLPTWPGRYLRLRVELIGTRRASPALHAIRVTAPRPSLLDWLPAYWRQDAGALPSFGARNDTGWGRLERLLALFEGTLSELEARTEALPSLWDPAAAPAEVLPWLAGLIGWTLDARLDEAARRRLLLEAAALHRQRGTVNGIRRLCVILADCEVQIVEAFRGRRHDGAALGREAAGPHETPGAVLGPGMVLSDGASQDLAAWYAAFAHRFTVVLYRDAEPDLASMVARAVDEYKPAHTAVELRWVGREMRLCTDGALGITTVPGQSEQQRGVAPLILGDGSVPLGGSLATGPAALPHPSSLYDRLPDAHPDMTRRTP